jgi:hypothetical protein
LIYGTYQNHTNGSVRLMGLADIFIDPADPDWYQIRARFFQFAKAKSGYHQFRSGGCPGYQSTGHS